MNSDRNFNQKLVSFLSNRSHWIITISVVIILCATLLPFDFTIPQDLSLSYVFTRFRQTTGLDDLILNIIFFMPLGLGLAAFFYKRNNFSPIAIIIIFIISFCLSLFVEICQLFLISRASSYTDLLTNTLGGSLGAIIFLILSRSNFQISHRFLFLKKLRQPFIQLKSLTILWFFYLCLMLFLLSSVRGLTKFSNWDLKFPLLVGNEATSDRPWSGRISYFCIHENSLSKSQIERLLKSNFSCTTSVQDSDTLITAYSFNESQKSYRELTGNLAPLDNRGITAPPVQNKGIVVGRKNWLRTKIPAIKLTQKIKDKSQFTIVTKIATNNFQQEGPARIISLSQNPMLRNLTVAQWRKDLTLRIRMPLTGTNGKKPEIRIKNFFNDTNYHLVAIAYDSLRLRTYVDRIENASTLYLGSEAALFWSVFSIIAEKMYLNVANDSFYHLLYYGFIFVPLGIGLGLISNLLQTSLLGWLAFIIGGLLIPPLFIEAIIVNNSDRFWHWNYLALGIIVLTLSFLLTRVSRSYKL